MMEIPARMAEVPADADVVVVCRSGGRSGQVVAYLRRQRLGQRPQPRRRHAGLGRGRPDVVSEDGQPARVL